MGKLLTTIMAYTLVLFGVYCFFSGMFYLIGIPRISDYPWYVHYRMIGGIFMPIGAIIYEKSGRR